MHIPWKKIIWIVIKIAQTIPQATAAVEMSNLESDAKHDAVFDSVTQTLPNHLAKDRRVQDKINQMIEHHVDLLNTLAEVEHENDTKGLVG